MSFPITSNTYIFNRKKTTKLSRLRAFNSLTFYKIYEDLPTGTVTAGQLNADFSVGSAVATYTSARSASAPATYVDASGVVQLVTTENVGRIRAGVYDETGFITVDGNGNSLKGPMMEAAGTNLITKSNNVEDAIFTKTNVTADNDDAGSSSPDSTATAPSLTATNIDGTFLLASGVTAQTYSVWIKRKTGTGTISITADSGATYAAVTVIAGWARFQVTAASASQTCGIKLGTSGDAIYIWGNQFEASPYMTSFIPTTTAALTRPADVLKYAIAGNRTVATESIFIKFAPAGGDFANDGVDRYLSDTNTKKRVLYKSIGSTKTSLFPNLNDNGAHLALTTTTPLANTSYIVAGVVQHLSPYSQIYLDGTSEGTYTAADFTDPAWGTSFYVGVRNNNANGLNGIIQAIAIFSDAKDATAVSNITDILE